MAKETGLLFQQIIEDNYHQRFLPTIHNRRNDADKPYHPRSSSAHSRIGQQK